jgi:hypothetical protein
MEARGRDVEGGVAARIQWRCPFPGAKASAVLPIGGAARRKKSAGLIER